MGKGWGNEWRGYAGPTKQGAPTATQPPAPKRQKFNAQPTVTNGRKFGSMKEARRYTELKLRLAAGEIDELECQPEFVMLQKTPSGERMKVGRYKADFRYRVIATGAVVVEDAKGGKATATEAYKLRKRNVEAQYGVEIVEV